MKLLANENIPQSVILRFAQLGYEIRDLKSIKRGLKDSQVVNLALTNGEFIVTFDKDYLQIINSGKGKKLGLILIKVGFVSRAELVKIVDFLHTGGYINEKRRLVVVSLDRGTISILP